MSQQSRLGARWRFRTMLLVLVGAAAIPIAIFAGLLIVRLGDEQRASSERRLVQAARAQALVVDRELASAVEVLEALAATSIFDSPDLTVAQDAILAVLETRPQWFTITLASPDGTLLLTTPAGRVTNGTKVLDAESFATVVRTGAPAIGTLQRGRPEPFTRGRFGFPVRVPVIRSGQVRYVLSASLTPETMSDLLVHSLPGTDEFTRTIVDTSGTVVARTRSPERFVGQRGTPSFLQQTRAHAEGIYAETTMDGESVFLAFSRGPQHGWTSAIAVPRSAIIAPARGSIIALASFAAAVLLLSGGAMFALARRVNADLLASTAAAEALARGDRPVVRASVVAEIDRVNHALERSGTLLTQRERERDEHLDRATRALEAASTANRMKDEFLAMLGHELRNPLAPIVTALEVARLRSGELPPEHAVIARQVKHLTRLVDDLLDVSRIARGKVELKLEVIEVQAVVARAMEMTSPLFDERRHEVRIVLPDEAVRIVGDPVRLAQVLANVLGNAAKYTPPRGHVSLRVVATEDEVRVEVRDNGAGIAPELLPHVFELFVQGPMAPDRRDGGLGLGLTLASSLVVLHDGTITAQSDGLGQGTTVTITLPRSTHSPSVARAARSAPAVLAPLRVLVVDDNADAADMLAETLRLHGHEVAVAGDGPAALRQADIAVPDVAVLDIGLPAMDGYELARRLRDRFGQLAPPCIAVSGYGQDHDRQRSAAAGFVAHLVKPVELDVLLAAIASAASVRQES